MQGRWPIKSKNFYKDSVSQLDYVDFSGQSRSILMKSDPTEMQEKITSLANIAYERELNRELSIVQRHIDLYRERESKFFNLKEIRLKFYRETSDEIRRLYHQLGPDKAVERAVALGLLNEEEIPEDIRNNLDQAVQCIS